MPILTCSRLFFSYPGGNPVLRDINFSVNRGEYLCIVGANGSGKSTLARQLNGLLLPSSGDLWIDGLSIKKAQDIPAIRRKVGMVFQSPDTQIVGTTVETDLAFALENIAVPRDEIRRRVTSVLARLKMAGFEKRATALLSAGEQQKLAIGCMMALDPEIIVFDEATSMIEPSGRKELLAIMQDLHQAGKTIIHITHDMNEASRANRILHLHLGEILHDLNPVAFFALPDIASYRLALPEINQAGSLIDRCPVGSYQDLADLFFSETCDKLIKNSKSRTEYRPPATDHKPGPGGDDKTAIISLDAVSFSYLQGTGREQAALENICIDIGPGEIIGIMGSTGSGKSSLLQHINALLLPQSGHVRVKEQATDNPKTDLRAIRRQAGLAFQRPEKQLFKAWVGDDIAYGLEALKLPLSEKAVKTASAMAKCGLSYMAFKDRSIQALSGGEKRKAALAGVVVNNPEILMLDEPTSGLDPVSRDELIGLISGSAEAGTTVLFTTHDFEVLSRLARRVLWLEQGKIEFDGSPAGFYPFVCTRVDPELLPWPVRLWLDPRFRESGLKARDPQQLRSLLEEAGP